MEAVGKSIPVQAVSALHDHGARQSFARILIGGSTGAVPVVETILSQLRRPCPPVVIAQHMPSHFLRRLSDRLQFVSELPVKLVTNTAVLAPDTVFLAGGAPLQVHLSGEGPRTLLRSCARVGQDLNCPSIERLFSSATGLPDADRTLAMLLSGMGHDGAKAMAALKSCGAETWVEDPQSAIVPSMPQSAILAGAAPRILPGPAIARALNVRLQPCNEDVC